MSSDVPGGRGHSMSGHQRATRGLTDTWLTPPEIIAACGPFDLDPCAAVDQPWDTAARHLTIHDDGLAQCWDGFVWCGPDGDRPPGPCWNWDGNIEAPTISPSILVHEDDVVVRPRCHSYVRAGQWEFLADCGHKLAGQTVPLVPLPDWLRDGSQTG